MISELELIAIIVGRRVLPRLDHLQPDVAAVAAGAVDVWEVVVGAVVSQQVRILL
jgi:3-methyladenine DNA glycosylase/8-oxoguanine DNA glycosylase